MPSKQYIIIGSGVSGTSTTLHLLDAVEENSTVLTIISRHQSLEPSDDISKIVRIDYATVSRMKEAICAQQHWQNNNRFKPFYQPVGRVVAYDESNLPTLDGIDSTRSQLGLQNRPRSDKAVLEKFYGKIETRTNLTFVWNEDDGLVDWRSCMQALTTEIEEHCEKNKGSSLREVFAQKLVHEENQISAICLDGGEEIDAIDAEVIVAAGPWIAELLERSGIEQPPISRTPVATGVFTFTLQLNEVQAKFFMGKPAFSHIGYAEFIPPTTEDGVAKLTRILSFTNVKSPSTISYARDVSDSSLGIYAMLEIKRWALEFIPKLRGAKIIGVRSYWDGMTLTQEPLISRHPQYGNLSIVGGLSYTRAKDIPVLGQDVLKLICGKPINSNYGWNPGTEPPHLHQPRLLAQGNFEELELEAERHVDVKSWKKKHARYAEKNYLEEI